MISTRALATAGQYLFLGVMAFLSIFPFLWMMISASNSSVEIMAGKVSVVEVKDVELPQSMQRAMARQAEAEREKRAKIIHAEGELQASQTLADAADVISANPVTIQLRYLQTLAEIGAENSTTIVFPLPIDLLAAFVPPDAGTGPTSHGTAKRTAPSAKTGGGDA